MDKIERRVEIWLERVTSSQSAVTTRAKSKSIVAAAKVTRGTLTLFRRQAGRVRRTGRSLPRAASSCHSAHRPPRSGPGGRASDSREHPAGSRVVLARPRDDRNSAHRCAGLECATSIASCKRSTKRCWSRCSPRASPRGRARGSSAGDTRVFAYLTVGAIEELLYQAVMRDFGEASAEPLTAEIFSFLCRGCLRIPDDGSPRLSSR